MRTPLPVHASVPTTVASEARDCLGVFAFVLWWKGSLMLEYDKQYETLGWAALTGATWTILRVAGILPERVRTLTRGQMLGGLLFGVSLFFLVMSAVDPLVQLGIQRMAWSSGLAIEVGFFVPAGIVLLGLSRRLRRDTRWPATERERTHHG